jgi:hypothetical protein
MSDKPVAERLQVRGTRRLAVVAAPDGLEALIGANAARADVSQAEVVLLFVRDRAGFTAELGALLPRIGAATILWVAYPKLTSSLAGDLSRDVIHRAVPDHGLTTVSQIAIDNDWSAMRLKRL